MQSTQLKAIEIECGEGSLGIDSTVNPIQVASKVISLRLSDALVNRSM